MSFSPFVDADITTDPGQLFNDALDQFNALLAIAGFPGWDSTDANAWVVLLNTISQIAADNATVASTMLAAAFRAFGTQLLNLPYANGAAATVVSTWTFTSPAPMGGYEIDTGTAVLIDAQTFYVQDTTEVADGETSATIQLVASAVGTAYNDLGAVNAGYPEVQLNDQIDYVSTVTIASVTSGGADQQDDTDYENALAAVLALQSPRPITEPDFAEFVASTVAVNATGVAVGRSTAISGYWPVARTLSTGGTGPAPLTLVGEITVGVATVSVYSEPYYAAVPYPGASVTGTGVPGGTTVAYSPAPTGTSFTMSANATATEAGGTLTIGAFSGVPGAITVFVTDDDGDALTTTSMDSLQAWLDTYLLEGVSAFIEPASYNTIYVTAEVHPLPGNSTTQAAADAQGALVSYLNPATWGNPGAASTGSTNWYNATQGFDVVRFNRIISVLESPTSVDYAVAGSVTLGVTSTPTGVADLTMMGPAPLPLSSTSTIVVTGI
jgi:hypothetical protein